MPVCAFRRIWRLVGCGNIPHTDFLRVPLTTFDQKAVSMGETAARLALSMIESRTPLPRKTVLLEARLVVRQSSMRTSGRVIPKRGRP